MNYIRDEYVRVNLLTGIIAIAFPHLHAYIITYVTYDTFTCCTISRAVIEDFPRMRFLIMRSRVHYCDNNYRNNDILNTRVIPARVMIHVRYTFLVVINTYRKRGVEAHNRRNECATCALLQRCDYDVYYMVF